MLVIVVIADLDVFQDRQRIIGQDGKGEVEREQVRSDAQVVEFSSAAPRGSA
jgi:hypothetical protein